MIVWDPINNVYKIEWRDHVLVRHAARPTCLSPICSSPKIKYALLVWQATSFTCC